MKRTEDYAPNPDLLVWPPNEPPNSLLDTFKDGAYIIFGLLAFLSLLTIMQAHDAYVHAEDSRIAYEKKAQLLTSGLHGCAAYDSSASREASCRTH